MVKKSNRKRASAVTEFPPLADVLRQAITDSAKSSYQLREETGVDHGVILRFMKGERDIRLETASKLAAAVGLVWQQKARPAADSSPADSIGKGSGGGASPFGRGNDT